MAVDRTQHRLYTINNEAASLSIFSIGPDGGLVSIDPNFPTVTNPYSVVLDATNQKLYVSGNAEVAEYSINVDGSFGVARIFSVDTFGPIAGTDQQGKYLLTRTPNSVNLVGVVNGEVSTEIPDPG